MLHYAPYRAASLQASRQESSPLPRPLGTHSTHRAVTAGELAQIIIGISTLLVMICGLVLKCVGSRRANVSPGSKPSSLVPLVTNPRVADYRRERTEWDLQVPPASTSRCCGNFRKRHLLCSSPSHGCAGIGFVRGWGFWPSGLGRVRRGYLEDIGFWVLPRRGSPVLRLLF